MSRPELETLAAQLSASLTEMSAALRTKLGESSSASPLTESPFRRPSVAPEKTPEGDAPRSSNGLLDAIVAALRRLVGFSAPRPGAEATRSTTKRFRSARHRMRKR